MASNNRAKSVPAIDVVTKGIIAALNTTGMLNKLESKGGNAYFGTQSDAELVIGGVVGRLHVAWNDLRDSAAVEAASVERVKTAYEGMSIAQLKTMEAELKAKLAGK